MCLFFPWDIAYYQRRIKNHWFCLDLSLYKLETKLPTLEKPMQVQIARGIILNDTHGDLREFIFLSVYKMSDF